MGVTDRVHDFSTHFHFFSNLNDALKLQKACCYITAKPPRKQFGVDGSVNNQTVNVWHCGVQPVVCIQPLTNNYHDHDPALTKLFHLPKPTL